MEWQGHHTHTHAHSPLIVIWPILTYFRRQIIWSPNTSPCQFLSTKQQYILLASWPEWVTTPTHFLSTLAIPKSPNFTIPLFIRKIFCKRWIFTTANLISLLVIWCHDVISFYRERVWWQDRFEQTNPISSDVVIARIWPVCWEVTWSSVNGFPFWSLIFLYKSPGKCICLLHTDTHAHTCRRWTLSHTHTDTHTSITIIHCNEQFAFLCKTAYKPGQTHNSFNLQKTLGKKLY